MAMPTVGGAPGGAPFSDLEDAYEDPRPYTVIDLTGPATRQVVSGPCRFVGVALIEPGGVGNAVFELYDGFDSNAQLLAVYSINASGQSPTSISHEGIECREGIFANYVSGRVRGVVWARVRLP